MKSSEFESFSLNYERIVWYFWSILEIRDGIVPLKLSGKAVTFGIYIFLLSIEMDPFEYSEISEPKL
jgi:hypothetical protein